MKKPHPAQPLPVRRPKPDTRRETDRMDTEAPIPPANVPETVNPRLAGTSVRANSKNHLPISEDDYEAE